MFALIVDMIIKVLIKRFYMNNEVDNKLISSLTVIQYNNSYFNMTLIRIEDLDHILIR